MVVSKDVNGNVQHFLCIFVGKFVPEVKTTDDHSCKFFRGPPFMEVFREVVCQPFSTVVEDELVKEWGGGGGEKVYTGSEGEIG